MSYSITGLLNEGSNVFISFGKEEEKNCGMWSTAPTEEKELSSVIYHFVYLLAYIIMCHYTKAAVLHITISDDFEQKCCKHTAYEYTLRYLFRHKISLFHINHWDLIELMTI